MQSAPMRSIGIVVLVGGFCLAGYGLGSTLATAAPPLKEEALAGVTQNWDKKLPNASRFTVLTDFGGAAVRDNETGLVWEQSPGATPGNWVDSTNNCARIRVGHRKGWRLPSIHELASLIDPTIPAGATLPVGHPFNNIQEATQYWSATTYASEPTTAWVVDFTNGNEYNSHKNNGGIAWCVRGPMNADAY